MRYCKDFSIGELKSNINVYCWSDGFIIILVGGEYYEVLWKVLGFVLDKLYNEF